MKHKLIIFFSVLLIVGVVVATSLVPWPIIKINHINCKLDNQSCPKELVDKLNLFQNKSFLFTNIENQILNINLDFYQLQGTKKIWPDEIELSFSSKINNYVLKLESTQQSYLVTENRLTYPDKDSNSVIRITLKNWSETSEAVVENKVDQTLHTLITNLIKHLNEHKIRIDKIIIHNQDHIEIILNNNLIAIVEQSQLDHQIAKLAIILEKLNFSDIDLSIKEIDLRFKLPVLRTNFSSPS